MTPGTGSSEGAGLVHRVRRLSARIGFRLLAFNLLLLFLPAAALLVLDTYERQLLDTQERAMVQQARLLAAALSGFEDLEADRAEHVLVQLAQRQEARLRVVDTDGQVIADSSRLGPRRDAELQATDAAGATAGAGAGAATGAASPDDTEASVRDEPLYQIGAFLNRLFRLLRPLPDPRSDRVGLYLGESLRGPAVEEALAGRYGADLVTSPGTRSVVLHSAIPVTSNRDSVVGAVLVSRSTQRILTALYEVRLGIFQVFLASVGLAVVLSLLLSGTIARPLKRLRNQAAALLDRQGRITGRFRGTRRLDEIGDLARALSELTRRLTEHQRFTESFASDVSHELKNPLASLRTATELLIEAESDEERRRLSRMALKSVARLEHLLSAVGEIGRIDAELEGEAGEPVPVAPLVRSLVEGFRLRHPQGPRVVATLPASVTGASGAESSRSASSENEALKVFASPDRLAQVVENLLDNAISFTPREGRVEVTVARRDSRVVVAVADTGPGIPESHLDRLFDRFFSYRPTEPRGEIPGDALDHEATAKTPWDLRNGEPAHSGLGLAIAKAIVERYGGRIRAFNLPEGDQGACFEVELPVRTGSGQGR